MVNRTRLGAALILGSLALSAAFADGKQRESRKPSRPAAVNVPVAVVVKTDKKTYVRDAPVKLTLTAKNQSEQAVRLPFSSGQRYDFEIRRGKGNTGEKVWQWAKDRMFTMMLGTVTLERGKSLAYAETYTPGNEGMPALEPGTYTLIGTLTTMGRAPQPKHAVTFNVK